MGAHRNNWTWLILVCLETSLFRGTLPWQQAWPGVTLEWWLLINGNSTWHCSALLVCFLFFTSSLLELLCARPARMVPVKFRGDLGYCFIQERQGEKAGLVLTCFWRADTMEQKQPWYQVWMVAAATTSLPELDFFTALNFNGWDTQELLEWCHRVFLWAVSILDKNNPFTGGQTIKTDAAVMSHHHLGCQLALDPWVLGILISFRIFSRGGCVSTSVVGFPLLTLKCLSSSPFFWHRKSQSGNSSYSSCCLFRM